MVRLVIDTDPGIDDAHALMMALAHPQAEIEAITTVSGNVPVERTTANACTILDVSCRDVPVYAGCERALLARYPDAHEVHGLDGLGDSGFPASPRKVQSEHAVHALVRLANEAPGELTLVAIAPLTNVALATCLDPDLPKKYKRLVVMGGAIHAGGNTTPAAEFNVHSDPEAAAIVFEAWKGMTLVSWETSIAHCFDPLQVDALWAIESPRAEFFRRISAHLFEVVQSLTGQKILPAPDLLAIAAAIEPGIVLKSQAGFVEVEVAEGKSRGQTVVDWQGLLKREPNVDLALELDRGRLWELIQLGIQ